MKRIVTIIKSHYKVILINLASLLGICLIGVNIFRVLSIGIDRYQLILEEKALLDELKAEELGMQKDLEWYTSLDFIETQSRDYLGLGVEGESVLVLPEGIVGEGMESVQESEVQIYTPSFDNWLKLIL